MSDNNSLTNNNMKLVERQYLFPFILITSLFALWGFANDITNPMVAAFQTVMELSAAKASLVQFAFYGGYATMAIPAALFIRKFSYKKGILLGTERCGVALFDADLDAVVFSLFPKLGQEHAQSGRAAALPLKSSVDHKLLQIIAGRFIVQIPDQGDADHSAIVCDSNDSCPVMPIDISSGKNAERTVKKALLGFADRQSSEIQPVFFAYFNQFKQY